MSIHKRNALEKAKELLQKMTFEEKIMQMIQLACTDNTSNLVRIGLGSVINAYDEKAMALQKEAVENSRLGIPILFSIDCIHGHALNPACMVFPSQLAMAQSFNPEALEACGKISAREAMTDGIRMILSPVLDIARDIRWCRVDETFGEDPYLAGELGKAMVQGYETEIEGKKRVICCPKHFIAHSESIGGRDSVEVSISDRKVQQFFMPPFRKAVEAGCGAIMSAQHLHDGKPMCANGHLINGMLKEQVGFEGFVITDNEGSGDIFKRGLAVSSAEGFREAIMAGNDMLMFCRKDTEFRKEILAFENDEELINKINDSVLRILTVKFAIGLFEDPYFALPKTELCTEENYETLLDITRQSMTLLENNGVLPIDVSKVKKMAVIGPAAHNPYSQYGDWTYLNMPFAKNQHKDLTGKYTSYLQGIQQLAEEYSIRVDYAEGCNMNDAEGDDIEGAVQLAKDSDLVVICLGDHNRQNGERHDRAHLELSGCQNELYREIRKLGIPTIVLLSNGRPLIINEIAETADAVLECFNSGLVGGIAAAEILFGKVNPSGRLPISFPRCEGQLPVYYNYLPGWHGGKYIDEEETPLYTFGYGLSYTDFEYTDFHVWVDNNKIKSNVKITNIGNVSGVEIPQLYVTFKNASFVQPEKNLKVFHRVELNAKESKVINFEIDFSELEIVNEKCESRFEGGTFAISIGKNSMELQTQEITIYKEEGK